MADTLQIRTDEDSQEKFKAIAKQLGLNYDGAIKKLMALYDSENAKAQFPDSKSSIDDMEGFLNAVRTSFIAAIESKENMRTCVRAEYDKLILSKDATISDLQQKAASMEQTIKELEPKAKDYDSLLKTASVAQERVLELEKREQKLSSELADYRQREIDFISLSSQIKILETQLKDKDEMIQLLKERS